MTNFVNCASLLDWECSEKVPGNSHNIDRTKTDTGRKVEYTKALERMMLKELGKLPL